MFCILNWLKLAYDSAPSLVHISRGEHLFGIDLAKRSPVCIFEEHSVSDLLVYCGVIKQGEVRCSLIWLEI